jgi:hypothetical protein
VPGDGRPTPAYLRCLWTPPLVRRACGEGTVLVALLRDPIERFASAIRWNLRQDGRPTPEVRRRYLAWIREKGDDAIWAGMYASQLARWARSFAKERFVVLQYEAVRLDPQSAVRRVWTALGLPPRELRSAPKPTWNSTDCTAAGALEALPGLRDDLRGLYEEEVATLVRDWGVDRALWPNFGSSPGL